MRTFLARQPIMNRNNNIVGYEFLFRSSEENSAIFSDGYDATLKVTHDLLINFGIDESTKGKRFFINFKPIHLYQKLPDFFKSETLTIELLDYSDHDPNLINIIEKYKLEGYLIALDDFTSENASEELIKLADFIKIDCLTLDISAIENLVKKMKKMNKTLIGKKIEDYRHYNLVRSMGFDLFQGYYFKKPSILVSDEQESIPKVYNKLLTAFDADEIDFNLISELIKKDLQLSVNFLKLINSVGYYSREKVTSLNRAVVRLGADESRKIVLVNLLKKIIPMDTANQLFRKSILRGKQAEVLAPFFNLDSKSGELFILGIFSLINIITGESMKSVLNNVPLRDLVKKALLGEKNELTDVLEIIILFERREMKKLEEKLVANNISIDTFNNCYMESLFWLDDFSQI